MWVRLTCVLLDGDRHRSVLFAKPTAGIARDRKKEAKKKGFLYWIVHSKGTPKPAFKREPKDLPEWQKAVDGTKGFPYVVK